MDEQSEHVSHFQAANLQAVESFLCQLKIEKKGAFTGIPAIEFYCKPFFVYNLAVCSRPTVLFVHVL
jgi:hypothetical protein